MVSSSSSSALRSHLDKLKSPHRSVQRHAVRSIFETLESGPPHTSLHSHSGQQTLSECLLLASRAGAALDEAVLQLCALAQRGDEVLLVLSHLQALLECAPPEAVPYIVRGIGFVCRRALANQCSIMQGLLAYEHHPLVKAFESRQDTHLEIVQQVLIMLAHDEFMKDSYYLNFLEPVLNYLLLHPSVYTKNDIISRELCLSLASFVSSNFEVGRFLMKLLVHCNFHWSKHTVQEASKRIRALTELVDALETWVMLARTNAEIVDCKQITRETSSLLVNSCFYLRSLAVSPLPILQLLARIVKLQKSIDDSLMWRQNVLSLAYLLLITDVTEEQFILISLARDVLKKGEGKGGAGTLIRSVEVFPFSLLWIYPTVNITMSSYSQLRGAATNLLQDLENLLVLHWTQNETHNAFFVMQDCYPTTSYGLLAENMHRILSQIWFNTGPCETWISLKSSTEWIDVESKQRKSWLQTLSCFLKEIFQEESDATKLKSFWNSGLHSWICMVASVFLIHPILNVETTEAIIDIVNGDTVKGLSFVPVVLFYLNAWKRNRKKLKAFDLLGLLKLLPCLAVDSMSTAVIVGTLQSMLNSEYDGVLQSTAIRLLCRAWEVSDKVFPQLQTLLNHSYFSDDFTNNAIKMSRAVSLCDVCRKDGDSGVELILSVQACIENKQSQIKALGLQSLSWLCHHDVVDFYTAWDFISGMFTGLPSDPILAESLCGFFQNGALDAAAYLESSHTILHILWQAAKIQGLSGAKVRQSALKALSQFEVGNLNEMLGNEKIKYVEALLLEKELEVISTSEKLLINFLHHEYKSRHREQSKRKQISNKTGKLISAIPHVLARKDKNAGQGLLMQSPAAYLLLKSDNSNVSLDLKGKKNIQVWETEFEREFSEIADQLNCQANLIFALLYLDSWIPFIKEQIKKRMCLGEAADKSSTIKETTLHIMKILCRISEQEIPRVAENAVLALAVLYQVSHTIPDSLLVSMASYLKNRLLQHSHEYLQWTSAIALGIVARNCSGVEWELKMDMCKWILQCLSSSDRDLVRGACGMALGFLDQNLMSQEGLFESGKMDQAGTIRETQMKMHKLIVRNIQNLFSIWFPEMLMNLGEEFSGDAEDLYSPRIRSFSPVGKECIWTVSGLCIAIACTVITWERIGALNSIIHVVEYVIDVIHSMIGATGDQECIGSLAIGAFLSLPACIDTCLRLEILTDKVQSLFQDVKLFLAVCLRSSSISEELKMSVCLGSGNFIATLLYDGTVNVCIDDLNLVIASMKAALVDKKHGLAMIGAFIGLANVLGGGAALVVPNQNCRPDIRLEMGGTMESAVSVPLLYSNKCKIIVEDLLQWLLNAFLQGTNSLEKSCAGWALALIRNVAMNKLDTGHMDASKLSLSKLTLDALPEDSTLYILSSSLLNIGNAPIDTTYPYATVTLILRCLKAAKQLPFLDWGTLIRRILQQIRSQNSVVEAHIQVMQNDLCKECILFCLSHGSKFQSLQIFLDELCDISRLISGGRITCNILILHMADLSDIFSMHRFQRFFLDCISLVCRQSTDGSDSNDLKINFWKGFRYLISNFDKKDNRIDIDQLFTCSEECLKLLDSPMNERNINLSLLEWAEALACVSLASTDWILKIIQVDWKEHVVTDTDAMKVIYIISQLVIRGRLPPTTLLKPVRSLCNHEGSHCTFRQLLWVTSSLKKVSSEDQKSFLLEAIEIACLSNCPDVGLLFLAMLVSSWCSYAPVLILDSEWLLKLLPFTLPSLLSEERWRAASKSVLNRIMTLLDKYPKDSKKQGAALYYLRNACIAMSKELDLSDQLKLCK